MRIELRWANDAPSVPVLLAPRAGAEVRDRTLVYQYTNQWALLAALADHRATDEDLPAYDDVETVTLALAVDTRPAAGGPPADKPTRVFLRLAVLAPGTTKTLDPPTFPSRAPRLQEIFAEETP